MLVVISLAWPRSAHAQQTPIDYEAAARAAFERAHSFHDFDAFEVDPGAALTLQSYMNAVTAAIEEGRGRAQQAMERYTAVLSLRSPTWTVAALVEQGRIYERLARGLINIPMPVRTTPDVTARLQEALESQANPIACIALVRYVRATRTARSAVLDTAWSRMAIERLRAHGDSRITECVDHERGRDPSFAPFRAGELDASAPGARQNRAARQPR